MCVFCFCYLATSLIVPNVKAMAVDRCVHSITIAKPWARYSKMTQHSNRYKIRHAFLLLLICILLHHSLG